MKSILSSNSPELERTSRPACKFAILSDIHANLEALNAVMNDAVACRCDRYACLGDIVGYNADPQECIRIVRRFEMPVVRGNHDEYVTSDMLLDGVRQKAATAIEWTRRTLGESEKQWLAGQRLMRIVEGFSMVHSTLDAPGRWGYIFDRWAAAASFNYQSTPVCFYGHTHVPMLFVQESKVYGGSYSRFQVEPGRKYLVNVGSVGQSRDGTGMATYVTYDLSSQTIELRRVAFDAELTAAKARSAGIG